MCWLRMPLTQWMLCDEPLELADELGVPAELEVGLDPALERGEPQLLQPRDRRLREALVGDVGQRRPAPQSQRLAQERRGLRRLGCVRLPTSSSNRCTSSSPRPTSIAYPGGRVTTAFPAGPSALRRWETRTWSAAVPDGGGPSGQSASSS